MSSNPTAATGGEALTVGSLFAGIGGFDLGFERAGFRAIWQVENDGKAQSVLSLRFPHVALHNDVRTANGLPQVDVITGGFPCQDVSVAGKRGGLAGERTGLFWQMVRIVRELQPRWMVLENVPGLLSSHSGRDFHTVLSALAELGFRRAYRILDSRYFGVAQRRRRVFIVLRARGRGHGAEPVLFESAGGIGDSAAGGEARESLTGPLGGGAYGTSRRDEDDPNLVTYALGSHAGTADGDQTNRSHAAGGPVGMGISRELAHSLRAGRPGSIAAVGVHANQRGELRTSGLAGSLNGSRSGKQFEGVFAGTLKAKDGGMDVEQAAAGQLIPTLDTSLGHHRGSLGVGDFCLPTLQASPGHHGHSSPRGDGHDPIVAYALSARPHGIGQGHNTTYPGGVRRLTPLECERLQGFPDGWTCLCGKGHLGSKFCECADSPRYRQLGNAVTVPVAQWIASRILEAEGVR